MDIQVQNHGSIFLFHPLSDLGRKWLHETAPEDAQFFGGSLAVEHRFAQDVAHFAQSEGLEVE